MEKDKFFQLSQGNSFAVNYGDTSMVILLNYTYFQSFFLVVFSSRRHTLFIRSIAELEFGLEGKELERISPS